MSFSARQRVFRAFVRARWLALRLRTRPALLAHQERQIGQWRQHVIESFPHHDPDTLRMNKADLMADFAAYNQERLSADDVRHGLETGYVHEDVACGISSGTSGNRGLYVITDEERYQWLGVILAKALPEVWRTPQRVAVILPQNSALYQAGNQSGWLRVQFYDLRDGPEQWADDLTDFDPTTIVAPPKILRWLAENADRQRISPTRLYAAAETLEAPDRTIIEDAFGLQLGRIYMATEGLLGVSCNRGSLHLAEEFVKFDFDWVSNLLATPIITDFSRRYQLMAGYRMNDLLHLEDEPCPCGSPLQVVREVVGRQDDVFWFDSVMVTPDILRNAVLDAHPEIDDFRVQQRVDGTIILRLPADLREETRHRAMQSLQAAFQRRSLSPSITLETISRSDLFERKLRRVERLRT